MAHVCRKELLPSIRGLKKGTECDLSDDNYYYLISEYCV